MSPAAALASLHRQILAAGEWVKVRREGSPAVEVDVMAVWRPGGASDLTTGTAQTEGLLILSPVQLLAEGFPDTGKKGDRVTIQGRPRTIDAPPQARAISDTLVRLEWRVKG